MTRLKASKTADHEHSITGEKLSLLAVFARPEDEAFGPSGTLAKYISEGVEVSLVTAARELDIPVLIHQTDSVVPTGLPVLPRDKSCNCRAAGIHRICLDQDPSSLVQREDFLVELLVRLIRELEPQVVVTWGPEGSSGDSDQMLISRVTTLAFNAAGDPGQYPRQLLEGLTPHQPQKLYYAVLPVSLIQTWGLNGMSGVPDVQITTVLDVSPYSEAKLKAVYCQRHHVLDYTRWLELSRSTQWNEEHFTLAASQLRRNSPHEKDLFAGLR